MRRGLWGTARVGALACAWGLKWSGEGVCQAGRQAGGWASGWAYRNATSKPAPTNRAMAPAMYATMDVPASRPDGPPRPPPWRGMSRRQYVGM